MPKRDWGVIRKLLLKLEESEFPEILSENEAEHLRLAIEAELVAAIDASAHGGPPRIRHVLTWQGMEFANLIRDREVFEHAMKRFGGMPFPLIVEGMKRMQEKSLA